MSATAHGCRCAGTGPLDVCRRIALDCASMKRTLIRRIPAWAVLGVSLLLPVAIIVGCQEESGTSLPASKPATSPQAAKGSQAPVVVQVNPAAVEGTLDVVDADFIRGWAMDGTKPTNPVSVDLYDGAALLASLPAKEFRQDLLDAGKGDGNHAFALPTPARLKDGKPHAIHAKCAGVALGLSPKTLPAS